MVVLLMEVDELLVLEVGDVFGLTSRVELVLTLLEQVLVELVHKSVIRVAHCALHLVVDNALVSQSTV